MGGGRIPLVPYCAGWIEANTKNWKKGKNVWKRGETLKEADP
jgi:hypothetical protein